jgi:hypothetical protein
MARARKGSREEEQGRGRGRTTRGVHSSRRWRGGGGRAAARGEGLPAAGEQSRGTRARGRRREGGGPGDLFGIFKDCRDLSVKKDFPLI